MGGRVWSWVLVALCGCATASSAERPTAAAASVSSVQPAAPSGAWTERSERARLEAFIADRSAATERDAKDASAWLALAEAHAFMADGMLVLGWGKPGEALEQLERASSAALSALAARDEALASALRAHKPVSEASSDEIAAALYWHAKASHARAKLRDEAERIASEALITAAAKASSARVPSLDHGGAFRLLGELAAHPADSTKRDLAGARASFERALSLDGEHVDNALALAEHYAIPAQDRALFEAMLDRARRAGATPENTLARARAEQLSARIEERFE